MNVQITKIKIMKEKKTGAKLAIVELTRIIECDDSFEHPLSAAVNAFSSQQSLEKCSLNISLNSKNLLFSNPGSVGSKFEAYERSLENFKLERIGLVDISMSFEFFIPLSEAKRWLIPAIGDEVRVEITDCQGSLPVNNAKTDSNMVV